MAKELLIAVARHGQTESNSRGMWVGKGNDTLNETGREQAGKLAADLKDFNFDYVLSSDKIRAMETAKILSEELEIPLSGPYELLRDRDYGEIEGMTSDQIMAKYGIRMYSLSTEIDGLRGVESAEQVIQRVRKFVAMAEEKFSGKAIVLITHGAFIRSFYGIYVREPDHVRFLNCSNFILQFSDGKGKLVRDIKTP